MMRKSHNNYKLFELRVLNISLALSPLQYKDSYDTNYIRG